MLKLKLHQLAYIIASFTFGMRPCCWDEEVAGEVGQAQEMREAQEVQDENVRTNRLNGSFLDQYVPLPDLNPSTICDFLEKFIGKSHLEFKRLPGLLDFGMDFRKRPEDRYLLIFETNDQGSQYKAAIIDSYWYPLYGSTRVATLGESADYVRQIYQIQSGRQDCDIQELVSNELCKRAKIFKSPCNPSPSIDGIQFFCEKIEYAYRQPMLFHFDLGRLNCHLNREELNESRKIRDVKAFIDNFIEDLGSAHYFGCPGSWSLDYTLAPIVYNRKNALVFVKYNKSYGKCCYVIAGADCEVAEDLPSAVESFVREVTQEKIDKLFEKIRAANPDASFAY